MHCARMPRRGIDIQRRHGTLRERPVASACPRGIRCGGCRQREVAKLRQVEALAMSWLYQREANKLLAYEREMAASTHVSIFVSKEEAALFKQLAPESADKTHYRTQGVDSAYFDPQLSFENPYQPGQKVLVFTGAMDYWPNVEAVKWFCQHVLDAVRKQEPNFLFCIVGMKPTDEVKKLGNLPGVRVTGGVPDVRPYLSHALAACLPLQLARGIQNKALEAMSMTLPVLAT